MIVVTGATGHIGSALVRELETQNEKVRALVLPGDNLSPLEGTRVETVEGNITDPASLYTAFAGADYVYHLAGMVSISSGKMTALRRINVDGTKNVVEACKKAKVGRAVLAGRKGQKGENYILSGEQVTVREMLLMLAEITGLKAPSIKIPLWLARMTAPASEAYYKILQQQPLFTSYSIHTLCSNSVTSHAKATAELGYQPRPISEAFSDTVKWLRQNHQVQFSS